MDDVDIEGLWDARDVIGHVLYVWYSRCKCRSCGVVYFGSSSKSGIVSSDEVVVKVVFEKARSRYSFLLEKLFVLSHTSWACLVRVLIVVALCDIGS